MKPITLLQMSEDEKEDWKVKIGLDKAEMELIRNKI